MLYLLTHHLTFVGLCLPINKHKQLELITFLAFVRSRRLYSKSCTGPSRRRQTNWEFLGLKGVGILLVQPRSRTQAEETGRQSRADSDFCSPQEELKIGPSDSDMAPCDNWASPPHPQPSSSAPPAPPRSRGPGRWENCRRPGRRPGEFRELVTSQGRRSEEAELI